VAAPIHGYDSSSIVRVGISHGALITSSLDISKEKYRSKEIIIQVIDINYLVSRLVVGRKFIS
jgi:ABC-type sulfate transport system permease subunit